MLAAFRAAAPDAALPDVEHLPWSPVLDPDATAVPVGLGEPLVALVSAVDAGGNEVAGIRLPEVAVPTAAYTGWNPRSPVDGLPDVLYELVGSRLPLLAPAPPPDEAAVRAAAAALVADRFLLPEDVERAVTAALTR
nr:alpha/beta hydrolase domain-containing protein [Pseudonocardia lacus]